ncbi:MAG: energy-coupled thiamine transporter ThiT [Clostridiales bacterium]|nr:energy-coupled thiamine transporter ThiT [Clostridiales bacterium]
MEKRLTKTRVVIECAILIAMAFVLSLIKIWRMPMGGSITLVSMLPILLIGYRHGLAWGLISGFVYSILQFIESPYFLTPVQFLLDYVFPFTVLGVAGFFRGKGLGFQIGAVLGIGGRFISHVLSGVIFFAEYAADAGFESPLLYSVVYNGSIMLPELVVTLIVGTIVVEMLRKMKL